MQLRLSLSAALALAAVSACGPGSHGSGPGADADTSLCGAGCGPDQVCVPSLGCRACTPGQFYCDPGNNGQILQCNADGTGGDPYMTCPPTQACLNGACLGACDAAEGDPSSVGCHFYAVDLDNEAVKTTLGITNDAAAQQFAVVVANVNDYPVEVQVHDNVAAFGQPPQEQLVKTVTVAANDLAEIDLPAREVDGTMGQNGTYAMDMTGDLGTFVSSHAYKIDSSAPITAVQFQPIVQQFSNDASLLLPRQSLGQDYLVIGWPTSNPCGGLPGDPTYMQSIPDHTFVTIIGSEPDTHVTVVPAHPVMASAGPSGVAIPQTPRGTPMQFTIGPYDVVNLESDQFRGPLGDCFSHLDQDGDFSGTTVHSDKPVMVFSGNERGSGTGGAMPPDPPGWDGTTCCTDHLEEQMLPLQAWGKKYVVSRSPVRSTGGYEEPDLYRLLAQSDGTVVNTSLGAPFDHFMLNAGEFATFYAYAGFTVESTTGAIQLGQILVSEGLTVNGIGDPSFLLFPAVDQHRDHYVFLVPTTFQDNYMVLAMPDTAGIEIDGQTEFPPACETRPIGLMNGKMYKQVTCRLDPGTHHVKTSEPAGLTVYGYYSVGSYDYLGGSDLDIINPIQ
jgi:hypothetical protein